MSDTELGDGKSKFYCEHEKRWRTYRELRETEGQLKAENKRLMSTVTKLIDAIDSAPHHECNVHKIDGRCICEVAPEELEELKAVLDDDDVAQYILPDTLATTNTPNEVER